MTWQWRAVAILALGGLGACATARESPPTDPVVVDSIALEGVSPERREFVWNHLLTDRPPRAPWAKRPPLDRVTLEEDVSRIPAVYRRIGYYRARAWYEVAPVSDGDRSVRVSIHVDEGERVHLDSIEVELDPVPEELRPELVSDLPLQPGEPFELEAYAEARSTLLARLADAGFPRATIEGGADVDLRSQTARVTWRLIPGPPVRFGTVTVEGLDQVPERLVRRELELAKDQSYSREALRRSQRQVYELGLFQSVVLEAAPPPNGVEADSSGGAEVDGDAADAGDVEVWPVSVRVVERAPRSVRVGAGYGTEERLRVQLGWEHRNFMGEARRLSIEARHSSLVTGLEAKLHQRRFLGPRLQLEVGARLERERQSSYDADRARAEVALVQPVGSDWRARVGFAFERSHITEVSPETESVLDDPERNVTLSTLELGLARSTLDDRLDPTRGSALDLSLDISPGVLGSEADFFRVQLRGRAHRPLGSWVLSGRLAAGSVEPFASTEPEDVPLVARFFSGGGNSVRGFDYRELGPLDATGEPLGGTTFAEASAELRVPLWRKLSGVVFVDAGLVHLEPWRWRLRDVFYSTGAGLRYSTPIGPVRIDFGYVLNPEGDVDRSRVHLGVGQAF